MIDPGPMLPEKGRYRALIRELNRLKACIIALRPMPGYGTRPKVTRVGTAVDVHQKPADVTVQEPTGEATWL